MPELERRIAAWRAAFSTQVHGREEVLDELEDHLREHIEQQLQAGLAWDEAADAAFTRLGNAGAVASEFAKVPSVAAPWLPVTLVGLAAVLTEIWLVLEWAPALREGGTRMLLVAHRGAVTLGYLATLSVGVMASCLLLARLFRSPSPEQVRTVRRAAAATAGIAAVHTIAGIGVGAFCPYEKQGWLGGYGLHEAAGVLVAAWDIAIVIGCLCLRNGRAVVVVGGLAGNLLVAAGWVGAMVAMRGVSGVGWVLVAAIVTVQLAVAGTALMPAGCLRDKFSMPST